MCGERGRGGGLEGSSLQLRKSIKRDKKDKMGVQKSLLVKVKLMQSNELQARFVR
jgi:hypothetical protein